MNDLKFKEKEINDFIKNFDTKIIDYKNDEISSKLFYIKIKSLEMCTKICENKIISSKYLKDIAQMIISLSLDLFKFNLNDAISIYDFLDILEETFNLGTTNDRLILTEEEFKEFIENI